MRRGDLERAFLERGWRLAGVDEVGRGCLAGPVYAACAVIDYDALWRLETESPERLALIRDSKSLSGRQRALIIPTILGLVKVSAVASASVSEIERLGINDAVFLAMRRALEECRAHFDSVLVDGNRPIPDLSDVRQETVVQGDASCFSIAAASILAKEARDNLMREEGQRHAPYGFESHVGYGTKAHLEAIETHGICRLHRRNFSPIPDFVARGHFAPGEKEITER
jgi:ribonuclease HII